MTREGEGRLSLALALVAASCIYAFSRVFSGRAWLVPVLAAAWGAIALSRWLTHRGIPRPVVACVVALAGAWFVVLVVFPGTTFFGLPGPGSLRQAVAAIRTADTQIAAVTAPIAPDPGYLAMAMTAAWVAGAQSGALIGSPDRRRSRERRTGLSSLSPSLLAPGAWIVLFTIAAGVGQGRGRLFDAALFFASLLLYLLAEGWRSIGRLPRLDGAVRLGVLSMAGALILPNLVPGYRAGPVFPWARLGPLTETTVSPLVQIKPFLLNQSSVTLFHVQADKAAYWRLTSLDHFDGKAWSSQGTYNPAAGTLSTPSPSVGTQPIRQHYAISSLGGIWVPAAFAPTRVSGIRASTDPSSQTLIVSALHPGVSYDIVSAAPVPTGDQLAAAGPAQAPGTEDLSLPSATVASIGPIARRVVGSATNAYEEAVALQDHLRSFAYDDQVPAGSSDNYLADFLTHTQRGFCEQFAGSMAVMLRTLGIPARVAVGFLPGRAGPSASGASYAVTGRQAHAWPEAYFAGIGWVAFEPTPRVDAPPPAYTISPLPATVPLTAPSPGPAESVAPTPSPTPANQASSQPARGPRPARPPISAAQRASLDILVALAFVLAGLFTAREMRFRLPGWLARTPQEKAVAAYEELTLRSGDALVPRRRGETETEYARSLVQGLSLPAAEVVAVTGAYQKAAYSMQGPGDPELQAALKANRSLRTGLWKRADWRGKARMAFSPRPLYTRSRRSEGAPTNPSRSGRAAPAGRPRPPAGSERIPPGPGGTRPRPGPGSW